ncbi:tripartite tricarboxylate transporter substrate binding protein [Reyranella sp.]|uniref:Bug family tripartite tricarboxylate transporter substrate binding protein n=1 Tax=Reyranella sp. TaxID=1929291 RepID=UPI0027303C65|nr:tripartite tricarboxylate transporter substrate binding protein [Reyranella sp.]MDP2374210.1 tripartite tricarboxylate transporter substrate binding protein [Reyranella sp.]
MLSRRQLLIAAAAAAPSVARAQTPWPTKPIRWIVNFPPAGAADIMSRALAEWFGTKLGQPIVVENKPGAGGMLGADIVAKARGDTHVVMISSAASHGIGPVLYRDVPYDPLADFTHIHLVGTFPSVLAVNAASPVTSVKELSELARAKPGEVTYGSGGNGTMNHLVGQLLVRETGVKLEHIPYRGSAPAMNDLLGGQITALMESLPTAIGYFNSKRMRPLAVSEDQRAPTLPETPTFREAGFPGVVATNWFGFSAPAGIPPELAKRWEVEMAAALQSAEIKERFDRIGIRPGTLGPEAYAALIRSELARWRDIIRVGNIRAD